MSEVLLSVDCSNRWTCLGLAVDGTAVCERNVDLGRSQAARLPILAEEILNANGFNISNLTVLAVTVGPGYFTGIRIGLAYVSALAYALGLKVVPLSSLQSVLRSVPNWNQGLKVPLIAASRDLVFSSAWFDGNEILEEKERTYGTIVSDLSKYSLLGALWGVQDSRLFASEPNASVEFLQKPSGLAMAKLACERLRDMVEPDRLRARYLREPGLGKL